MSASLVDLDGHRPLLAAEERRTVVQVTYSLIAGGSEVFAYTLASHLDPERFRNVIIALDKGGALEPELQQRGIPYFVLDRPQRIEWRIMRRLYHLFRQHEARIVHTHHFAQLTHAIIAARLAGARLVHMEHSVKHYERRRYRWLLRFFSLFCHKVIAIGDDVARVLRDDVGIPERKLAIIRAGIDVARYKDDRDPCRQELGLAPADPVAIIVARLSPEKNHCLLLAAFDTVRRNLPTARLLIVGEGPEEDNVRRRIDELGLRDHVRMLGVRRDVPRLLAAADVFALSSDREGLPIAVLEAMAAGKPVVATSVGDLPNVIQDGQTGRLCPPGNAQALATALANVLSDPSKALAMGQLGQALVERDYSLNAMIAQHEAAYAL